MLLQGLRARLSRWIAPKTATATRMYAAARATRLTAGWQTSNSSSDAELATSLTALRSRARALVRDAAYPKRAKVIVVNNVVGPGIGMQGQVKTTRDALNTRVNDAIEEAFADWSCAENCHTGGALHFADLERLAMGQVFEAGEIFIRKHPRAFGESRVPFALEVIEAERIADELASHGLPGPVAQGAHIRMGVEVDNFYRPLAYWIRERHPGEFRLGTGYTDRYERVLADQILHLRIIDRWPQTRGEPWLHAVVRKLNDMDGLTEAEITAARGAASYMATIETPDDNTALAEKKPDGTREIPIEPGTSVRLNPGEEFKFHSPNRPNTALDPFMRMMLRETAAGAMVSYESLSRDYSQSNYSSSRLALLDDRDLWRMLQQWFIRSFRLPLHREWLQQAILARAIEAVGVEEYALDPKKFEAARFKPRGWSWIDPTKEVEAAKEAVRNGFTTTTDVIAQTADGRDIEDVLETRRRELDMMAEKDLMFDTDPKRAASGKPQNEAEPEKPQPEKSEEDRVTGKDFIDGMMAFGERLNDGLRNQPPPVVNVQPPVVHVRAPEVHVAAPEVRVEPKIVVNPPDVKVEVAAPDVHISVSPDVRMDEVELHVHNKIEIPPVEETVQELVRDENREVREIHTRRRREGAG